MSSKKGAIRFWHVAIAVVVLVPAGWWLFPEVYVLTDGCAECEQRRTYYQLTRQRSGAVYNLVITDAGRPVAAHRHTYWDAQVQALRIVPRWRLKVHQPPESADQSVTSGQVGGLK